MIPGQLATSSQPCPGTCGRTDTRLYACGWRCPDHTPARLAGHPEPDVARYCAPNRCYCGQDDCEARGSYTRALDRIAETVVDVRAKASGRRRSSPAAYREAQAAVRQSQERWSA